MPLSITLVVRCFNEDCLIGRLLTGIPHHALVPEQMVIGDSGSTDATRSILARSLVEITSIDPVALSGRGAWLQHGDGAPVRSEWIPG